jgi:hypothetical protein
MSTRARQFLGGPKDGEVIAVPDGVWEYRVHLAPPLQAMWLAAESPPPTMPQIREGVYSVCSCHNCKVVHWEGER